jgi:hypothetical protein
VPKPNADDRGPAKKTARVPKPNADNRGPAKKTCGTEERCSAGGEVGAHDAVDQKSHRCAVDEDHRSWGEGSQDQRGKHDAAAAEKNLGEADSVLSLVSEDAAGVGSCCPTHTYIIGQ